MHFPTDINLLWDASRKCIQLVSRLCHKHSLPGWRKSKDWYSSLKGLMRTCWQVQRTGGKNKQDRIKKAVNCYLQKANDLELKIKESISLFTTCNLTVVEHAQLIEVKYFQRMLNKHIDLVKRRLIEGKVIPHDEKMFSLFEPHTQWIKKGKSHPSVELGRKLSLTTDQYHLILQYNIMDQTSDNQETLKIADDLFNMYGETTFNSISFDKGFSCMGDRELLELFIPHVIMPKKGRLTLNDKDREGSKIFKLLRKKHSSIESNINSLEHHGLNRCPDKGPHGFKRYVGLGVLAYNCHKIGDTLFEKEKLKLLKKVV